MDQLTEFLGYSPMQLIVPALLFVVLSPGCILTIPPESQERRWFTCETSHQAIIIHGMIFAVLYFFIRKLFPRFF